MTRLGAALLRTDIRLPGANLPLMSVSQVHGVIRRDELTDKPARAETLDIYKVVRKGEIAFNKMSIRAGALGVSPEDGLVTYHYEVMKARPEHHAQYLVYLMKSSWFISELVRRERGIGSGEQANVRTTEVPFRILKTIDVPLPPLRVQRAIADYLDRETALIDQLIGKQNAFIERLRERRSGLILAAVTGAAQQDRKPAKMGWADSVPASWAVLPLDYLAVITLGKMIAPVPTSDRAILAPYLRAANVQPDGATAFNDLKEMWFEPRELEALTVEAGDVVVVEGGQGGFGRAAFVHTGLSGVGFQNSINRLRPRGSDGRFLTYALIAIRGTGYMHAYCDIVSMPHLTAEKLARLRIGAPSLDEQRAIADHLDSETAKIDELIAKVERHIELAKERRSALITAAFTKQIDVGGA